ncbi:hypothetical protein ACMD2_10420, partial [Ananas comosus]
LGSVRVGSKSPRAVETNPNHRSYSAWPTRPNPTTRNLTRPDSEIGSPTLYQAHWAPQPIPKRNPRLLSPAPPDLLPLLFPHLGLGFPTEAPTPLDLCGISFSLSVEFERITLVYC